MLPITGWQNLPSHRAMTDSRTVRQFLQLLRSAGVSHLPSVSIPKPKPPRKMTRARSAAPKPAPTAPKPPVRSRQPSEVTQPERFPETTALLATELSSADQKHDALCKLASVVSACKRCTELADTRRQTVFGVGNADAEIMFVGEAPGADEDRQGEPFVGAAGQLLNKIIQACGLTREDIYICNILRCRPPGNRNPAPQEATNCREFLDAQISIVQPKWIVCWGSVAAQNLLDEKRSVGRLRGQVFQHGDAQVMCTYHPSYLLRNADAKKLVWEDMKLFMKHRGVEL